MISSLLSSGIKIKCTVSSESSLRPGERFLETQFYKMYNKVNSCFIEVLRNRNTMSIPWSSSLSHLLYELSVSTIHERFSIQNLGAGRHVFYSLITIKSPNFITTPMHQKNQE